MAPKAKKKDPNAPTLIPEDTYLRARKLADMKVPMAAPKGELKDTEWCIGPQLHSMPEFKQVIHYWKQCAIVSYNERKDLKTPSRTRAVEDESTMKKPHPLKELKELFKYMKSQCKQANKRTGQFLKQLEKKEGKELKREGLLKQISDVDKAMNEELRSARRFTEKQGLFEKKYMIGSKLGYGEGAGPRKHALILVEASDKQAAWVEETKDEITKLINEVIKEQTETLNLAIFSAGTQTLWCPQFQSKEDPKKGVADAEKWLKKNINPKGFAQQSFPPDYCGMLNRFTGEGQTQPWRIYICCSRRPDGNTEEVLQVVRDLRANGDPPAKGEPILPMNIVAFDPTICGNDEEKAFFEELAGPNGSFMIDTSQEDLVALDKMLKAVQVKKKQLDKLNKKLDKMEDLSERVTEDRALFQVQVSLQRMLEEDLAIIDWAMKNENQAAPLEI